VLVGGERFEGVEGVGGDAIGLLEAAQTDEGVGEAEVAGDHFERLSGQLGGGDRPIGGDPCGVGLVLAREGGRSRLVGPRSERMESGAVGVGLGVANGDL
jgi:hypothetical protein